MIVNINSGNKVIPIEVEFYTPQQEAAFYGNFDLLESNEEPVNDGDFVCFCMEDSMDTNARKLRELYKKGYFNDNK